MNPNDTTDPAFPVMSPGGCQYSGLTKREYFAALAMQGLLSSDNLLVFPSSDVAKMAIDCADELIKSLNK